MQTPWFKAKRYGLGWYPSTWQGWLIMLAFVAFTVWNFMRIDASSHSNSDTLRPFIIETFGTLILLTIVCWLTGEKLRWSWGKGKNTERGFTLIELLITVGIIAVLAGIVLVATNGVRAKSRDSKRQQDLVQVAAALEMYYSDHGKYPISTTSAWNGAGTGTCGPSDRTAVSGPYAYIPNLTPEYISVLPVDPAGTSMNCGGYLYQTDSLGSNYKLIDNLTPESFPSVGQKFYDPATITNSRHSWMLCSGGPACDF